MNMAVKGVIQLEGCEAAWPATPRWPSHTIGRFWEMTPLAKSQCLPGWVSS